MGRGGAAVPITDFQREVLQALRQNRLPESHLAGASALHLSPTSLRRSGDLDFFHDGIEAQRAAFARDRSTLDALGFQLHVHKDFPGHTQAAVSRGGESTLIDWATDTDWRFLPIQTDLTAGYLMHPIDLAVNKVLALVGRDEPRDYVDALWADAMILPLPALVWAASGKDPGLNPSSTLALLRRRGRPHEDEVARLDLVRPFDLTEAKTRWLAALDETEAFIRDAPPDAAGALFYDNAAQAFVLPSLPLGAEIALHHGARGGVVPMPADAALTASPQVRHDDGVAPRVRYPAPPRA